jgi:hypothetical protein
MNIEAKLKHLEFIQNTITRMANNSFLLKGWAITLVVAIFGLNKNEIDIKIVLIATFLTLMFWALDAYFLNQERIFRGRYDEVRVKKPDEIDFSMKLEGGLTSQMNWFVTFTSVTLRLYYGILLGVVALFGYFL